MAACLTTSSSSACGSAPLQGRGCGAACPASSRAHRPAPVDLARQALDPVVTLMGNRSRVHVRQPAACQPGLEGIEPVGRHIEGIEPPGAAHAGAKWPGLASGAGDEIDHHLATLGVRQQGQLRALVLRRWRTRAGSFCQRRLSAGAQAPGRIGRYFCFDSCLRKPFCTSARFPSKR